MNMQIWGIVVRPGTLYEVEFWMTEIVLSVESCENPILQ